VEFAVQKRLARLGGETPVEALKRLLEKLSSSDRDQQDIVAVVTALRKVSIPVLQPAQELMCSQTLLNARFIVINLEICLLSPAPCCPSVLTSAPILYRPHWLHLSSALYLDTGTG